MVIRTKFMTVRADELAAVGRNEKKEMFLVFRSGSTQRMTYNDAAEMDADFEMLSAAMQGPTLPALEIVPKP